MAGIAWVTAAGLGFDGGESHSALPYFQRALTLQPERMDLIEKVQELLSASSNPDGMTGFGMPRTPCVPGPPRPPNPLNGLDPGGYGVDPLDPRKRR